MLIFLEESLLEKEHSLAEKKYILHLKVVESSSTDGRCN